jgi:hypothetical protein
MITVISDPLADANRLDRPVRKWKRSQSFRQATGTSAWAPYDEDEKMEDDKAKVLSGFSGEESLIPETIPDELWQSHFRQHDAELNDRKETEHLLWLYKQCSGRWPVIYDRWQLHPVYGPRGKSLESLKSKFNKVIMKLLEIDIVQKRKPANSMERMQVSQPLKYLPIFCMKYNEKNEYLRRLFLENQFKRQSSPDATAVCDKFMNELMRIPNMTMKHKKNMAKPPIVPGPQLASSQIHSVHSEISLAESNRLKAVIKSLGIDRSIMMCTPKIAKLFSIVEREAHTLLMMRDSLQRKKQELEILRTSGGINSVGQTRAPRIMPAPPAVGSIPPQSTNAVDMMMTAAAAQQQKRKRQQ